MRRSNLVLLATLCCYCIVWGQFADPTTPAPTPQTQPTSHSSSEWIEADNEMVAIIKEVQIAAEAPGKITEMKIEEGVEIAEGDVVAVIDDKLAVLNMEQKKAEEEQAILEASNEVNLTDAKNNEELAKAEADSFKELRRQKAINYWDMKKKELEATRATLRIDLADMQMKVAKAQYFVKRAETKIAQAEIDRRRIKAPFAGYIELRTAQPGQWVEPGSPIATLVQMDKLRVNGTIDAREHLGVVKIGSACSVEIINRNNDSPFKVNGTVGYVSSKIDINGQSKIWVEIKNSKQNGEWLIKPGMRAEISIRR